MRFIYMSLWDQVILERRITCKEESNKFMLGKNENF